MSEDNSPSLLSKPEKEKMVKGLLKQGKTFIQIAKVVHMSFGDIGRIKRDLIGEQEVGKGEKSSNNANKKTESTRTQAFRMLSAGKSRVEVAIELDLQTNEVEGLSKEYWLLKSHDRLPGIYDSIKKDLPSFFRLYHLIKDKKIKNEDILKLLKCADKILILNQEVENLENRVNDLIFQRGDKQAELESIMKRIAELDQQLSEKEKEKQNRESDLQWLRDEIYEKRQELQQLRAQISYLMLGTNWYY